MARTARAAFTKGTPVRIWLYYFEKCFSTSIELEAQMMADEVAALLKKAEEADKVDVPDCMSIPEELEIQA